MAFKCQNNRNPFIMFPDLIDFVYRNDADLENDILDFRNRYNSIQELTEQDLTEFEKNNVLNVFEPTIVDITPMTMEDHKINIFQRLHKGEHVLSRREFEELIDELYEQRDTTGFTRKQERKCKKKIRRKLRRRFNFRLFQ